MRPASAFALRVGLALVLVLGCEGASSTSPSAPSASAPGPSSSSSASAAAPLATETALRILRAEHRRTAAAVLPEDQQSRAVETRRLAARALSRIGGEHARAGLLRALSDEDLEVVRWAAYGVGFHCRDHATDHVSALVARALSLPAEGSDEAFATIARAVGQCGAETSEATLVAWLKEPDGRATGAALGLGDLVAVKKRLREDTLVALLHRAEGSAAAAALPVALFPLSRLERVPPSVVGRLVEVASRRLDDPGEGRVLAIRALGRGGAEAAAPLAKVLAAPAAYGPEERSAAIGSLARLERAGQAALVEALRSSYSDAAAFPPTFWTSAEVGTLLAHIDAIGKPGEAESLLRKLATLAPPDGASPPVLRRVAWVRCRSATRVVGGNYNDPLLLGCDVAKDDQVAIGERALVEVLGRRKLTGREEQRWRELATTGPLRSREAAISLAAEHLELADTAPVIATALAAEELGLMGTAAEAITAQPLLAADAATRARARRTLDDEEDEAKRKEAESKAPPGSSSAPVTKALLAALDRSQEDPEVQASLIGAVGALTLKEAVGLLEPLCASSYPVLRERAAGALNLITGKKPTCEAPEGGGSAPAELEISVRANAEHPVEVVFESDVGALVVRLRRDLAPVAVQRIVELVEAGYYAGNVVHRVVPGFVSQLGAPRGDGYGGPPGKPPLRCETSPAWFGAATVGVALAGRDTGSSQLFVTHAMFPHLDGKYAWLGTAEGDWRSLVDGDRILAAKVRAP